MDTYEARTTMLDMAADALDIVEGLEAGKMARSADKQRLRAMLTEARSLLPDAGYPGEAVWRGLQRASVGLETSFEQTDPAYWQSTAIDLRNAVDTLEPLVSARFRRESDFHIVG